MLLVSSGGFIQLFFGDVENYSITAVLVIWYLLVGSRVIRRETTVWAAALIPGLAMCFHLEAGFLLPSLAYLAAKHHSGSKQKLLYAAVAVLIPFALVLVCMLFFNWLGILPLENLWLYSHATAHGGNIASVIPTMTIPYYLEILNLLILLFPAILLLPIVLVFKKLGEIDIFLLIATGFLLLLPLGWKAALGVLNDWNLYAMLAIPGSILVWSLIVRDAENGTGFFAAQHILMVALGSVLVFTGSYSATAKWDQFSVLLFLSVSVAVACKQSRAASGLFLSLIPLIKPALSAPIVALRGRSWFFWAGSILAIIAVSVGLSGLKPWQQYATALHRVSSQWDLSIPGNRSLSGNVHRIVGFACEDNIRNSDSRQERIHRAGNARALSAIVTAALMLLVLSTVLVIIGKALIIAEAVRPLSLIITAVLYTRVASSFVRTTPVEDNST